MTDKQIQKIALGVRKGILGKRDSRAYCFAVSAALQGYLRFCGIETEISEGDVGDWNHFWLTLPDGRILDATADQFGLDPVYLGHKPENYNANDSLNRD